MYMLSFYIRVNVFVFVSSLFTFVTLWPRAYLSLLHKYNVRIPYSLEFYTLKTHKHTQFAYTHHMSTYLYLNVPMYLRYIGMVIEPTEAFANVQDI